MNTDEQLAKIGEELAEMREQLEYFADKQGEVIDYVQKGVEGVIEAVRTAEARFEEIAARIERSIAATEKNREAGSMLDEMAQLHEEMNRLVKAIPDILREEATRGRNDGIKLTGMVDNDADINMEDLFERAKRVVAQEQKATVSVLRQKLGVDSETASSVMSLLEERGVVGPVTPGKAREILISQDTGNGAQEVW